MFNDYILCDYKNTCVQQQVEVIVDDCVDVVPAEIEEINRTCQYLNPAMQERPPRDGHWIMSNYKNLYAKLIICHDNVARSGNSLGLESIESEWHKCSRGDDVVCYAIFVLGVDLLFKSNSFGADVVKDYDIYCTL